MNKRKRIKEKKYYDPRLKDEGYWRENSPAAKFFDYLSSIMKTPDGRHFALVMDDVYGLHLPYVAALVELDCIHNHCLGLIWSYWNSIHIRSITVCNEYRNCGFLGSVCAMLIGAADYAGVFLNGTAKPFKYDLPVISNGEDLVRFIEGEKDIVDSFRVDDRKKREAEGLRDLYLKYGFCKYDSAGYCFENEYWRKTGIGYLGSGTNIDGVADYFSRHLKCA